jgi:hypothetical protein
VAFTPFKPLYQGKPVASAGSFVGRQDANYIAVVTEGDVDRMRIVFHEYAHLVISNVLRHVPAWLSEGLAEFYSTYELRGGREAVLGRVIPYHLQRLQETRLLKLDELLSVDRQFPLYNEKDRRSVFYALSRCSKIGSMFAAGHAHQRHWHIHASKCAFHGDRLLERNRVVRITVQQKDRRSSRRHVSQRRCGNDRSGTDLGRVTRGGTQNDRL